ncbi:MAG TPA: hypothetical protein VHM28_00445 [Anaerolineales bacterium]|nr:hypothetical protein [Anaerolineales bacterium]
MTEDKGKFLGTYFERDAVIRMARVIDVISWVIAGIYALDFVTGLGVFILQILRGMIFLPGFTDYVQNILFILERPVHGALYFAAMQAVSKGLLIFLDVEDNTRRAARK